METIETKRDSREFEPTEPEQKEHNFFQPGLIIVFALALILGGFYYQTFYDRLTYYFKISKEVELSKGSVDPYLDSLYARAVSDALKIEANEYQAQKLRSFNSSLPNIEMKNGKVKVALWVDEKVSTYYKGVKKDSTYLLKFDVWTTIAPDLKNFCINQKFKGSEDLELRLEQLLGLPHTKEYDHIVELWVDTAVMVRPTPIPKIDKFVKGIDSLPAGSSKFNYWYYKQMETAFEKELKFPWTRLGYTFDWGGDADDDFGLSEFVLLGESLGTIEVLVDGVYTTEEYCLPQANKTE